MSKNNVANLPKALFFYSVFIFCILFVPSKIDAATMNFSSGQSFTLGQNFTLNVVVSTESNKPLNAISASISFPKDKLELVSISKTGTIINFWVDEPIFSNSDGTAKLEGVVLNPGWSGNSGKVLSLNFKVKSVGSANISFSSASILANDGQGTNILTLASPTTLSLGSAPGTYSTTESVSPGAPLAPIITSITHPDQNHWYKNNSPKFSWKVPKDVTAVRLLYDNSPVSTPTVEYGPSVSSRDLSNIKDGVYYFHAQFKNENGWGAVSHLDSKSILHLQKILV